MLFDVRDRLEILNQLSLYAHYFDEGMTEEWVALFAEDAVFSTSQVSGNDLTANFAGPAELLSLAMLWTERKQSLGQNRHLMTSVAVLNQSEEAAEVHALGLLIRTHPDGRTSFWSPGRYTGSMRKFDATWLIHRWHFRWDADPAMNL